MLKDRYIHIATVLVFCLLVWAAPGQTASHALGAGDLPASVVSECEQFVEPSETISCGSTSAYSQHRIGTTVMGELFMVMHNSCSETGACKAWFLEKTTDSINTLLAVNGSIKLSGGQGRYPSVMVKTEVSASLMSYDNYEWDGVAYSKVSSSDIYRIDGVECGTAQECKQAAQLAVDEKRYDDAVKIWQTVFGVAWI